MQAHTMAASRAQIDGGANAHTNISDVERWGSALGGAALAVLGLTRGRTDGMALGALGAALIHRGVTGHCYLYEAIGVDTSGRSHHANVSVPAGAGLKVEMCTTINRPAAEVYHFWRDFENLPSFMAHLQSVECKGTRGSHWVAKAPLGMFVSWDAEIYNEEPNRMIAWRSLAGSQVDTAGSVHFEPIPGNRGTYVRLNLKYDPPAGKTGALIARLFGRSGEQEIAQDLRRFKQLMEAGEIPTSASYT